MTPPGNENNRQNNYEDEEALPFEASDSTKREVSKIPTPMTFAAPFQSTGRRMGSVQSPSPF